MGFVKTEVPMTVDSIKISIFRFNSKFTRTFVELDEEAISVMTEIEDDDNTPTGYHSALPLEVHGSAYQPMAMISNAKVCIVLIYPF